MYKAFKYYVSDHSVQGLLLHCEGCKHLPAMDSRAFIGSCYTTNQAITVASSQYSNARPCPFCLAEPKSVTKPVPEVKHPATLCKPTKPKRKKAEKILKAVRHFPL